MAGAPSCSQAALRLKISAPYCAIQQRFNLAAPGASHKTAIDFTSHGQESCFNYIYLKKWIYHLWELLQGLFTFSPYFQRPLKQSTDIPRVMSFAGIFRRTPRLIRLSGKGILILFSYCSVTVICTTQFYVFCIAIKGNKYMKYQAILGCETWIITRLN